MGAPAQAYFLIDAKFRGLNNVEQIVNPAKAQAILATLKARFYLDDVIAFKAVWAGVEYHGFWGKVLPSGFNYNHHKTSRLLEINGPKPGQILRTFNDAGLNTTGDAQILSRTTAWANYVKLNLVFLSAYYLSSSSFGVYYKKSTDADWITITLSAGQLSQQLSETLNIILNPEYNQGDTIQIKAFIINAENTYASDVNSFTAAARIVLVDAISRTLVCDTTGAAVAFYMKESEFNNLETSLTTTSSSTGILAHSNDLLTITLSAGNYAGLFSDPKKVVIIDSGGQLTNYVICAPSDANMSVSTNATTVTGGYNILIDKVDGFAFGTEIVISGKIQAYNAGVIVTADFQTFSVTLGASAISNSAFLSYSTDPAYTYEFLNVISTPSTVGGVSVIITGLSVEESV